MNSSSTTWGLKCKPRDLYGGLLPGSVWPIMFRPGVLGSNLFKSQPKRKILIGYHASKSILDLYASIYLISQVGFDRVIPVLEGLEWYPITAAPTGCLYSPWYECSRPQMSLNPEGQRFHRGVSSGAETSGEVSNLSTHGEQQAQRNGMGWGHCVPVMAAQFATFKHADPQ